MLQQIRQLTAVQLCNLFGVNEVRFTRDKKKKQIFLGLAFVWLLLILMLVGYTTILSSAFVKMGMADIVPFYLFAMTSLVILVFSFFKAGSIIFQMKTYEMVTSLPVKKTAIVVSRFLTMYVTNLMLSFLVMIPGTVIFGIFVKPGISFYLYSLLGILLLPLLPVTLATAIGAGITAISARMKHKSLVASGLTILFVVLIMAVSMMFSGNADQITEDMVINFAEVLTAQIGGMYPPAVWFGQSAVNGNIGSFLLFAGISILAFILMVAVLQKYFLTICSALNATSAKNNYKMQNLSVNSPVKALWKKELKRYFASSIYVSNTIMGYLLMAIAAVALFLAGAEQFEKMLNLPHVVVKVLPYLLGLLGGMMPITACSISMEGKWWWMAQTLPIKSKHIFDSKILMNLTIALPFYIVAVIFGALAVKPSPLQAFWLIVIPAAYILFTSILGITVNLAMPIFDWENETRVVKQSASTMITMLLGFVFALPPLICTVILPVSEHLIFGLTLVILLGVTAALYVKNNKR